MATVTNGTVSAVAAGAATITATIEVEGVTYSDTCTVTVEAVPVSNVVFDLTAPDNWNNPELWSKQDYQETSRGTYIIYDNELIECVTNLDGSSTSLYADISPIATNFEYDENYNYYLELYYDNAIDGSTNNNSYKVQLAGGATNTVFIPDNWTEYVIEAHASNRVHLPLMLGSETANRYIVLQIRKLETVDNSTMFITAKIIREPK